MRDAAFTRHRKLHRPCIHTVLHVERGADARTSRVVARLRDLIDFGHCQVGRTCNEPGVTVRPRPSMRRASRGTLTDVPSATMRPPDITSVPDSITPCVTVSSLALMIASVPADLSSACSGRGGAQTRERDYSSRITQDRSSWMKLPCPGLAELEIGAWLEAPVVPVVNERAVDKHLLCERVDC